MPALPVRRRTSAAVVSPRRDAVAIARRRGHPVIASRRGHAAVIAVVMALLSSVAVLPVDAQTSAELGRQIERVQDELERLSAEVETLVDEYHEAQDALDALERELEDADERIDELTTRERALSAAVTGHVRRLHMLGPSIGVAPVLVAAGPGEAAERAAVLRRILDGQRSDLEELGATRETLAATQRQLARLHEEASEQAAVVAQRRDGVEAVVAETQARLERLDREYTAALGREELARREREQAAARAAAEQARTRRTTASGVNNNGAAATGGAATGLPPRAGAQAAVDAALSRIGMPYRWGATGPNAFDCSGLVVWAWRQAGVNIAQRSSAAQFASLPAVSRSELRPGDLVYAGSPRVHHVGMYIGNGQIVHAPYTGRPVEIRSMERSDLRGFRRPA